MALKGSVGHVDDTPSGHYFDVTPTTASRRRTVPLVLPDLTAELTTDRGVFSGDRVDAGTRLLLLEAPSPDPSMTDVLDLGCGYGPIAVALACRSPSTKVWAVDVNERAVELTRDNAERLGLTNIVATTPDGLPDTIEFDAIWSNPPVRVGKEALHELLLAWLTRLKPGGHGYLVTQRNLGADSLQRWLIDRGWATTRLASKAGYRLFDVAREASL
jgi:16S rRNA (guanine1207-N2)-methyltransferase